MKLKTKIVAIALLSMAVACILVSGLQFYLNYQNEQQNSRMDLRQGVEKVASETDTWFNSVYQSGELLASQSIFQRNDQTEIQNRLETYMKHVPGLDSVALINSQGRIVNKAPYEASWVGADLSDRDYFRKTIAAGTAQVSDVVINQASQKPNVVITYPIKDAGGNIAAVLLQTVDLGLMQEKIAKYKVGQTGYYFLTTADAKIIVHPDLQRVIKQEKAAVAPLIEKKSDEVMAYRNYTGKNQLGTVKQMSSVHWFVAAAVSEDELMAGFYKSLLYGVVALAAVLIIVSFLFWRFLSQTLNPLQTVTNAIEKIAGGDLTAEKMNIQSKDEIGTLAVAMNDMKENLAALISGIAMSSQQVAAASEELTANAEQSSQAANQIAGTITGSAQAAEKQANIVNEAVTMVNEVCTGNEQGAAGAGHAVELADKAVEATQKGHEAIGTVIRQMQRISAANANSLEVVSTLGARSQEIGQIVETISGIAGQTNLLALNAAIEAARAGEHGRGFAVVADEVRKLAEQSQEAAKQIAELIGHIQSDTDKTVAAMQDSTAQVNDGTKVVDKAGAAFRDIEQQIQAVREIGVQSSGVLAKLAAESEEIASRMKEIGQASQEVMAGTQTVSAATEEQSAAMEEVASASQSLAQLAQQLQNAVSKFQTN